MIVFVGCLCLLLILLFIFFIKEENDFVAPNFIFVSSMLISSAFYIFLFDYWKTDIRFNTFLLMSTSIVLFVLVSFYLKTKFKVNIINKFMNQYNKIEVNDKFLLFTFLLSVLIIFWSFFLINEVGSITLYRELRIRGQLEGIFLINQLSKVLSAVIYVLIYIEIFNNVLHKNGIVLETSDKKIVPIVIIGVIALLILSMGRQVIIEYILYSIALFFIFKNIKCEKIPLKKFIKIIFALSFIIPLFYYGASLVGRDFGRISKEGAMVYVGKYLSCGINHLDDIVQNNISTNFWGQSSFAGIYQKLNYLNLLPSDFKDMYFHPFNNIYGNTVTIFGRWFEDFGYIGVFIMTIIVSYLFTYFYLNFVNEHRKKIKHFCIMLYAMIIPSLFWAGYDDRIMPLFTINFMSRVFLLFIVYKLVFRNYENQFK